MKKVLIIIGIAVVLGVAYYGLSPLFNTIEVDDALPENIVDERESGEEGLSAEEQAALDEAMEEANATPAQEMNEPMPESGVGARSIVMGTTGHPAEGYVRVLSTSEGPVIRYEDFETINGPQLHVYLAKDLDAREFVDLGPIKGTRGNINYEVPTDVDLDEYRYVMYWCVPFGVLFNYAELTT